MKYIINLFLILVVISLVSCKQSNECEKYFDKDERKIEQILEKMDKSTLAHEIYLLGECKIEKSLPILKKYITDPRITHHALHKGMSIGHIAKGSIRKIEETKK